MRRKLGELLSLTVELALYFYPEKSVKQYRTKTDTGKLVKYQGDENTILKELGKFNL